LFEHPKGQSIGFEVVFLGFIHGDEDLHRPEGMTKENEDAKNRCPNHAKKIPNIWVQM
jgi:hypothetical protein